MSLLASSRMELGWNYPKLNALFNAVTNYRNKMMKGIISSFKNYDQVSPVIQPEMYKSYIIYSFLYKFL